MGIPAFFYRIWWQIRYRLWAIRVAVSRLTGDRISAPPTAPPCFWDYAEKGNQLCENECGAAYKGGGPAQVTIDGVTWYFCCPKGYEAGPLVVHPITKRPIVTCIRK
jgi:hypothetical protein